MAANTNPIYSKQGHIEWGTVSTANTAKDGTGTVLIAFTASATDGSRVEKIRFRALGTNVATVARVFINNGSTNTVATNNILYDEITLPATTLSEVAQLLNQEINLGIVLPANYRILVTIGTTVASGYAVSVLAGDY